MIVNSQSSGSEAVPAWQAIVLGGMAGGLGWGIRGQYGHETGAMIAGVLVGLTFVFLMCPKAPTLGSARAAAWCAVGIGFGGSMTYGQTVGLTHDSPLIGNWAALSWGMLGLGIKGGIWIGFAGAFLGLGLGGVRYRPREMLLLMAALLGLFLAGTWLLNEPFDPANRILPRIYFSDDWRWEPGAELKPRRELWGGLLLALAGLVAYARGWRHDGLALRLGAWGFLAGAVGFPLGQCLQAYHAWNLETFQAGYWARLDPLINWWNMMETTFGAVMGSVLGLGLWLNRRRMAIEQAGTEALMPRWVEWLLFGLQLCLLLIGEFFPNAAAGPLGAVVDSGLAMGVVPVVAIAGGRWWPFLVVLPLTVIPIAGKTVRQLCYREPRIDEWAGWLAYGVLPLSAMALGVWWLGRLKQTQADPSWFARRALVLCTWVYFGLNFAFFDYPWLWSLWTRRTLNGILFSLCAIGLTVGAWQIHQVTSPRSSRHR